MGNSVDRSLIDRRDFLKLGVVTAATATAGLGHLGSLTGSGGAEAKATPGPVCRTLGRTGLKVTIVSFGAMLTPEYEVIRAGFDLGINYVDTARRYLSGRSEEVVAKALKGIRDKVYVATKTLSTSQTKKEILADVEASLSKLQTDRIDVIQLHSLTSRDRAFIPETREAYLELRKAGKVRFFGITTHTNQAEVINAVVDDPDKFFDVVLVAYNFKSNPEIKQAIARAAKAGIGVVAMKTQAGGYKTDALGPVSPHQAALKWVLQDPNVTCAIPGMKDMGMLGEATAVMRMKLTARDERILERYGEAIDPYYCQLCGKCEPLCPQHVAISVINRSLMYAEGYDDLALARSTYREVGESMSASFCLDCSQCVARCVRDIDISARMRKAHGLLA
jgi:predicted aldo/keto reductase-like oxidoreductase